MSNFDDIYLNAKKTDPDLTIKTDNGLTCNPADLAEARLCNSIGPPSRCQLP